MFRDMFRGSRMIPLGYGSKAENLKRQGVDVKLSPNRSKSSVLVCCSFFDMNSRYQGFDPYPHSGENQCQFPSSQQRSISGHRPTRHKVLMCIEEVPTSTRILLIDIDTVVYCSIL